MLYGTPEQDLPTPHGYNAIIIFNGVELPYSQKRDESPAGEKTAEEKRRNSRLVGRLNNTNILSRANDKGGYNEVQDLILREENSLVVGALLSYNNRKKQGVDIQEAEKTLTDAVGKAVGRRRALNEPRAAAYVGRLLRGNGKAREGSYLAEDLRRYINPGRTGGVFSERLTAEEERKRKLLNEISGEHKKTFTDPAVEEIISKLGDDRLNQIADDFLEDLKQQNNTQAQSRSNQSGFSYAQNRKGETSPVFQLFASTITANK